MILYSQPESRGRFKLGSIECSMNPRERIRKGYGNLVTRQSQLKCGLIILLPLPRSLSLGAIEALLLSADSSQSLNWTT